MQICLLTCGYNLRYAGSRVWFPKWALQIVVCFFKSNSNSASKHARLLTYLMAFSKFKRAVMLPRWDLVLQVIKNGITQIFMSIHLALHDVKKVMRPAWILRLVSDEMGTGLSRWTYGACTQWGLKSRMGMAYREWKRAYPQNVMLRGKTDFVKGTKWCLSW